MNQVLAHSHSTVEDFASRSFKVMRLIDLCIRSFRAVVVIGCISQSTVFADDCTVYPHGGILFHAACIKWQQQEQQLTTP